MASTVENIIKMIRILQNEECVSGQELAYRLGVSVKTIQKYKQDMDQMHIFVETKKGRYGGYYIDKSVLDIYTALSQTEIEALIQAKKHLRTDKNFLYQRDALQAIDKVIQNQRVVSPLKMRAYLNNQDGLGYSGGFERIKLDKIKAALKNQRSLYIEYENDPLVLTEQVVHPYASMNLGGKHLLIAFCEIQGCMSSFNVEKIRYLSVTKYTFIVPEGLEVKWNASIRQKWQGN